MTRAKKQKKELIEYVFINGKKYGSESRAAKKIKLLERKGYTLKNTNPKRLAYVKTV